MWLSIIYLIVGLALILWGADALTDGSSAVAKKLGVSDLVIGMTVVGFGTSMPELAISVLSAARGSAGLAIGNVVGSNLLNILLIIGLTAIIIPIEVKKKVANREIVLLVLSSLILLVMGNGKLLDGASENIITRIDGIILLIFFVLYMWMVLSTAKGGNDSPISDTEEKESEKKPMGMVKAAIFIVGGLAALVFGADRFVAGAQEIARALGMSDALIGLTIVAIGTSLPELATSITSAFKGKADLAVGNVIGSNIFNVLLILGVTGTYKQLPFGDIGNVDLLGVVIASVLFWVFARFYKDQTITRLEGSILVALYIAYTCYLISQV